MMLNVVFFVADMLTTLFFHFGCTIECMPAFLPLDRSLLKPPILYCVIAETLRKQSRSIRGTANAPGRSEETCHN